MHLKRSTLGWTGFRVKHVFCIMTVVVTQGVLLGKSQASGFLSSNEYSNVAENKISRYEESTDMSIFRNTEQTPGAICLDWCFNHPAPWRDPDVTLSQKCRWPASCGGCPKCYEPTESPTSSPDGFSVLMVKCYFWCETHPKPWDEKCMWPEKCAACPECYDSVATNVPFPKPSSSPTIYITPVTSANPTQLPSVYPIESIAPSFYPITLIVTAQPSIEGKNTNAVIGIIVRANDKISDENVSIFTNIIVSFLDDLSKDIDEIVMINSVDVVSQQLIQKGPKNGIDVFLMNEILVFNESYVSGNFLLLKLEIVGRMKSGADIPSDASFFGETLVKNMKGEENMKILIQNLKYESIVDESVVFESTAGNDSANQSIIDPIIETKKPLYNISNPLAITAVIVGALVGSLVMLFAFFMVLRMQQNNRIDTKKKRDDLYLSKPQVEPEPEPRFYPSTINVEGDQETFSALSIHGWTEAEGLSSQGNSQRMKQQVFRTSDGITLDRNKLEEIFHSVLEKTFQNSESGTRSTSPVRSSSPVHTEPTPMRENRSSITEPDETTFDRNNTI